MRFVYLCITREREIGFPTTPKKLLLHTFFSKAKVLPFSFLRNPQLCGGYPEANYSGIATREMGRKAYIKGDFSQTLQAQVRLYDV